MMSDRQCGDSLTINNKNAYSVFKADLIKAEMTAGDVTSTFSKNVGQSDFLLHSSYFGSCALSLDFYVYGSTKDDCDLNVSNLVAEGKSCLVLFEGSNVEFVCVLTSYQVIDTTVDFYKEVILEFSSIRRMTKVTQIAAVGSGSITFNNSGNVSSGVKLTITSSSTIENVEVCGIEIERIDSNIPFIIDGIDGLVISNSENKFLSTNLINFPKVNPGTNTFNFDTRVSVVFEFYPTFVI